MRINFIAFLFLLMPGFASAQQNIPDSLRTIFNHATHDSVRISACWDLYNYYEESNRDSADHYITQGLVLARKHNKKLAEARFLVAKAYQLLSTGRYAESLNNLLKAFSIIESREVEKDCWVLVGDSSPRNARLLVLAYAHHTFANLMTPTLNTEQQIFHYREAMRLGKEVNNAQRILLANLGLGRTFMDNNKIDSALIFETEAERIVLESGPKRFLPNILSYKGALYLKKGMKELALQSFYKGIASGFENNNRAGLAQNYYRLSNHYLSEGEKDSALYYAKKFEQEMQFVGAVSLSTINLGTAYEFVYLAYKLNDQFDSAFKFQALALITKDSISNARINSLAAFQNLSLREQLRVQDMEKEKSLYLSRVRSNAMLAGLAVFSIIAIILYRNNKQKQKANKVLESTLTDLKATQSQLIQSEKMASLGELTAGIAHEIQNPLNFVNNFSELSNELIAEMNLELDKGDITEAKMIASDISQNLVKINHHGKRADSIVKGMLQHSQKGSGQKEPTDINAMAEEYLRLAYHGCLAKDITLNASFVTDLDKSIGNVNLVQQDISRVLLNLYNNAFYAVAERQKMEAGDYQPTVTLTTKKKDNFIEITVKDNGIGIPENIKEKIFQPFFTTKPTGQGTGLGLSLSYDIVKAHGGELRVETKLDEGNPDHFGKNEGTIFIIQLPII